MKSLVGTLMNKSAVPYVAARNSFAQAFTTPGPMVQQMEAMSSVGTLFAIVTKLSQGCALNEWKLWRKTKSGKKEDRVEVTSHLALNIWSKPNDFFTRQELVETGQQHMELTGETWWVIARDSRSTLPLELWPVRPDKMRPVPDADEFVVGYIYTGPSGEMIPLERNQVLFQRSPDPMDMYRGMSPVGAILPDLNASNMAATYMANFFKNSAEPGGIIEVEKRLSDEEFDEMTTRWREQHQGVSNAHRVAVLEQGKWVDRKFSMKDMEFTSLRQASSEVIREAFGFPKPLLGSVDDVNRANAEAAEYVFAQWLIVPRLERIKQTLNNDFLPLFFPKGAIPDVEFDYVDPVPENQEFEATDRKSRAETAAIYINLGFSVPQVCEMLEIPAMDFEKPAPVVVEPLQPPSDGGSDEDPVPPAKGVASNRSTRHHHWPTAAADLPEADEPDLTPVQDSWEKHLAATLATWVGISDRQKHDLADQVRRIIRDGAFLDLLQLETNSADAAAALQQAMTLVGAEAAAQVVSEASAQGVDIAAVPPSLARLGDIATVTSAMLAASLAATAVRETMRVWNTTTTLNIGAATVFRPSNDAADDVAALVLEQLMGLSEAQPKAQIGSALTMAQRQGRVNTLAAAPTAAWYASEQLDKNTCAPCRKVHGKWLGNSIIANVNRLYPTGGYIDCLGRERCRGQVVGVWRPEKVGDK